MIDFIETSREGLGIYNTYPYFCSGYCFFEDYIILSLDHGDNMGKLMAITVNDSGVMTVAADYDLGAGDGFYGVYTDGTYIYHYQIISGSRRVQVYTFNGTTFTPVTFSTLLFGFGSRQMTFGAGFIFGSVYAGGVRAVTFDGSTFTDHHSSTDLTANNEAPLYFFDDNLYGLLWDAGEWSFKLRVLAFNEHTGFSIEHTDTAFEWYWNFAMKSTNEIIWNNKLYSYSGSSFDLYHTYSGSVPGLSKPLFTEDNLIGASASGGLHYILSVSPWTYHGTYALGTYLYFYFKFRNYEFFMNNELDGSEYTIKCGEFIYSPDLVADFTGSPLEGNRGLSVNFTDLST